nr:PASTA domain-containing protein [Dermacoccus sp. Tok2021]
MVDVPDVVGMSAADARRTLEDAGFEVDGGSWLDDLLDGTVSSQSPEGGSGKQAPKGSTVTLNF